MRVPAAQIYFPEEDREELGKSIDGILKSGQLTLGRYTREFEERFAQYVGTRYAVAVNGGTSALEIILRALDIEGSTVIVPTNTFFASPTAVVHAGGEVIFADVIDNLCLDPRSLRDAIRKDTKAVMLVHIGGIVAPQTMEIQQICEERNLYLFEDAAHAHGSTLNGKKAGSFGIAAAFSFYPTKVITSGEGGMITTDDENIYHRALVFRDEGKAGFSDNVHTEMGYNWRMSEIHAAIGLSQFTRLEEFIASRRRIAQIYNEELAQVSRITPLKVPSGIKSNFYKYVALLDEAVDRAYLKKELNDRFEVHLSGPVFELPCHLQPILKKRYGYEGGEYPIAEDVCRRHICLPIFSQMTEEQARHVISSLEEVIVE